MPDRFTARLWNAQQGYQAIEAAWAECAAQVDMIHQHQQKAAQP